MLGYDAVDNMLFQGTASAGGIEPTFNRPNYVNGLFRKYDRDFEPATLAKQAGRGHKFEAPPRRMKKLPQWDWVTLPPRTRTLTLTRTLTRTRTRTLTLTLTLTLILTLNRTLTLTLSLALPLSLALTLTRSPTTAKRTTDGSTRFGR